MHAQCEVMVDEDDVCCDIGVKSVMSRRCRPFTRNGGPLF